MIKFEVKIWDHWGKVKVFYFAEITLSLSRFLPVKFGTILDHFSSTRLMLAIKVKGLHE